MSCCSHSLSELSGRRVGLFSYGSGLAASMFSMKVCAIEDSEGKAKLQKLIHGKIAVLFLHFIYLHLYRKIGNRYLLFDHN